MFEIKDFDLFEDKINKVYQLRTKTNGFVIQFEDPEKEDIFKEILKKATATNNILSISKALKNKYDQQKIIDVLDHLKEFNFNFVDEVKADDETAQASKSSFLTAKETKISIIGESDFSKAILAKAKELGYRNAQAIQAAKANLEQVIEAAELLIVDGNAFNPSQNEEINKLALKHGKPWLYVGGLEGSSIKIGPLFWGSETGCYHCLVKRQNSLDRNLDHNRPYFDHLRETNQSAKPDTFIDQEAVSGMIANIVMFEIGKLLIEWTIPATWKSVVSIDLMSFESKRHRLLKIPHCEVCKPKLKYHLAPWLEAITLK